jgi:hypothetical protein
MFTIMCERSGGRLGFAQAPLKNNGHVETFPTREHAQARADHLNTKMNHPFAVACYRYWVVPPTPFVVPLTRDQRAAILTAVENAPDGWETCWEFTDAYGEPGYVPCQGYDWSGFRDSSDEALIAMAARLGLC